MDFKHKLATLIAPKADTEASPSTAPVSAQPNLSTLAQLRLKMAEILENSALRPNPRRTSLAEAQHEFPVSVLPFVREEHSSGPLFRRHQVLMPSHHVGRMPVDAAACSRPELLGLLALDPRVSTSDPRRALYFDTETTGLGGAGVLAFLVGLAWFDADLRLNAEQFLLRSPAEELPLLEAVSERVERADLLVSYNGKAFDLPLLNGRMVMNRQEKLADRAHLDLLHVARRLHKTRLGACRLVSLESDVLGFERGPDIAGIDIAPRYAHFLRTGDDSVLEQVIEHNAWDVVSMAALVALYGEPFDLLHQRDLVGLARTLKRARAFDEAERAAALALKRGAGPEAHRAHGEIAKARGDRAEALVHFEAFAAEVDDPAVRLELAKLYEHHLRAPVGALGWTEQGTGEAGEQAERRRARLAAKISRAERSGGKAPR